MVSTNDIRRQFLDFFAQKDHRALPSSSLVPHNDPTLMFSNAGMNQFKNVFTGAEAPKAPRAATSQKCVRAGGKHNDLDNVGYTARHHTFFEMLGNFSFGDYFKEGAIIYAWELLTKVWGLPPEKLGVTVYHTDDEAFNIWKKVTGFADDKILRIPTKDNFWQMGDTGPCGPCSEIFYDHGSGNGKWALDKDGNDLFDERYVEIWNLVFMQFDRQPDGKDTPLPAPSIDTGMGLERIAAVLQGVQSNYDIDLFKKLIAASEELTRTKATGEQAAAHRVIADHLRSACFLMADGVLPSNEGRGYVLRRIMRRAMRYAHQLGCTDPLMYRLVPALVNEMGEAYPELKRAEALMTENLRLEEERFKTTLERGLKLLEEEIAGLNHSPLEGESQSLGSESDRSDAVRGKKTSKHKAQSTYTPHDSNFVSRLRQGFGGPAGSFSSAPPQGGSDFSVLPGQVAFQLYDTYGFPLDLTQDILRGRGMTVDTDGFDAAMAEQKARARAAWSGSGDAGQSKIWLELRDRLGPTEFLGYSDEQSAGKILAIVKGDAEADALKPGEEGFIVFNQTPFYAESGGQLGDTGWILAAGTKAYSPLEGESQSRGRQTEGDAVGGNNKKNTPHDSNIASGSFSSAPPQGGSDRVVAHVLDTKKPADGLHVHKVKAAGALKVGDELQLQIDVDRREQLRANHSATHLLNAALKQVLGEHVTQKGSEVAPDRLRFDISHNKAVTPEEIAAVETLVNQQIWANTPVTTRLMATDEAIQAGAVAMFGEKYGDEVRVLSMGYGIRNTGQANSLTPSPVPPTPFSVELCGGTHVRRTGDIGLFKITSEGALAAGVRRIEAVTRDGAFAYLNDRSSTFSSLAQEMKIPVAELPERIAQLQTDKKTLEKQLADARKKLAMGGGGSGGTGFEQEKIGEITYASKSFAEINPKDLRDLATQILQKIGSGVVMVGSNFDGKAALVAAVSKDLTGKIDSAALIRAATPVVGGQGGGGRPEMAQGGGPDGEKIAEALAAVKAELTNLLDKVA